jgi:phospholipase A1/A2
MRSAAMTGVIVFLTMFWVLTIWGIKEAFSQSIELEAYENNYIIRTQGEDENNLRFQFSVVSDLVGPIRFAYTQRAIWRLWEPSAPITDIDFNPSIFFDHKGRFRLGYEHESNGMDKDNSRSWERVFAYYGYDYTDHIHLGYKAWQPFFLHENREITEFQGKGELYVKIQLGNFWINNTTREKNNTFEAGWDLGDFSIYGQSFNGYGKNIKEYDELNNYYGIGVSL